MKESYLDTFDTFFFNVEKCPEVKAIADKISDVLESLIIKLGELYNEFVFCDLEIDNFVRIVIISFIRKIMEQLDSINTLCSICSFDTAQIILRSLIENIISLEFILKDDVKKRAASYFLYHHYEEIDKVNNNISLLPKEKAEELKNENDKKRESLMNLISKNEVFSAIDNNRTQIINSHRNNTIHIKWYSFCSKIKSFKQLMEEVGYEKYYDSIYGGLSFETHGYNATMALVVNSSDIKIQKIRNPFGEDSTFQLSCTFTLSVLTSLYNFIKDGEEEKREFNEFYIDLQNKREEIDRDFASLKKLSS